MKKIYPSKMRGPAIFLFRSITAFAKKYAEGAKVSDVPGHQWPSLKLILNCIAAGITTERNANFSLTAKPAYVLVQSFPQGGEAGLRFSSFIQFSHLEFRSIN